MRRTRAALGSALFLVIAPGVAAGLVPWLITSWDTQSSPALLRAFGVALIVAGVGFLLQAFTRFVVEGLGTPAPVAPPRHLVIGGVYRHVRNPMYLAVTSTIVGQALLLGQPALLIWAGAFGGTVFCFVRLYEEPTLRARFGDEYDAYRRGVPGWVPRLRAWRGLD